jgi:hypothetical protein
VPIAPAVAKVEPHAEPVAAAAKPKGNGRGAAAKANAEQQQQQQQRSNSSSNNSIVTREADNTSSRNLCVATAHQCPIAVRDSKSNIITSKKQSAAPFNAACCIALKLERLAQ